MDVQPPANEPYDDPKTLEGELAGRGYSIRGLGSLLTDILLGKNLVYDNPNDFKPAVERVRVTGCLPEEMDPSRVIMSFNAELSLPQQREVSDHLSDVLRSVLSRRSTIIRTGDTDLSVICGRQALSYSEQGQYVLIDQEGRRAVTISAPSREHRVLVAPGVWARSKDGKLVRKFPSGEIKNILDLRNRLRMTMDVSSFVIGALAAGYLGKKDLVFGQEATSKDNTSLSNPQRETIEIGSLYDPHEPADEKITLASIGGLEGVKKVFEEIVLFSKRPELASKWGIKKTQSVLLYGPPGTGKTMLATALASELDAELQVVGPDDIYGMWVGESEKHMRAVFTSAVKAAKQKPVVVFFDEIDGIIMTGVDNPARSGVAAIFKQEMSRIAQENPNLYIIAATNDKDRMDPALIRSGRFDHQLYIPLPNEDARRQIFANFIADVILRSDDQHGTLFEPEIDMMALAKRTDGLSGSDITEILRRVLQSKAVQEAKEGSVTPVSGKDLFSAISMFNTNG